MFTDSNELKKNIALFLENLRDDNRDVEKCVDFLRELQRSKSETSPPIVETITMIKYEKPILFSLLKQRLQSNQGFNMIFQLSLNYNVAKEQIQHVQMK